MWVCGSYVLIEIFYIYLIGILSYLAPYKGISPSYSFSEINVFNDKYSKSSFK